MKKTDAIAALAALAACQPSGGEHYAAAPQDIPRPPPGSNEMLRAPVSSVEGLEVIISDVVIPPGAQVPRHFHPGEDGLEILAAQPVAVDTRHQSLGDRAVGAAGIEPVDRAPPSVDPLQASGIQMSGGRDQAVSAPACRSSRANL